MMEWKKCYGLRVTGYLIKFPRRE